MMTDLLMIIYANEWEEYCKENNIIPPVRCRIISQTPGTIEIMGETVSCMNVVLEDADTAEDIKEYNKLLYKFLKEKEAELCQAEY